MSRCIICNCVLSEQELTHKDPITGGYTDMCYDCLDIQEAMDNDSDLADAMFVADIDPTDDSGIDEYD